MKLSKWPVVVLQSIFDSPTLAPFSAFLASGADVLAEGLWDTPKAVLAAIAVAYKPVIVVTSGIHESRLFDDVSFLSSAPVHEFPAWETLPSEQVTPSPDVVGERYGVLAALLEQSKNPIILCPLQSCLQRVLPPHRLAQLMQSVSVGDEIEFSQLIALLETMGFSRRVVAADKGEYAVRGGILDLFPVDSPDPYRLEFFGDEVESIRRYDPIGQRSVGPAEQVRIVPAKEGELLAQEEVLGSLLDYTGDALLFFDDLLAIEDRYVALESLPGAISRTFIGFHDFLAEAQEHQKIYHSQNPVEELGAVTVLSKEPVHCIEFEMFSRQLQAMRWQHPFQAFGDDVEVAEVICVASSEAEAHHVRPLLPAETAFVPGYLSSSFVIDDLAVVPTGALTGKHRVRRRKQRSTYHTPPSQFRELSEGELVVHYDQGIGRYLGIDKRKDHTGREQEFLAIEYAETGKLYLPMTQSHLLSRYIGSHEERPKLSKLGSGRWARARAQTEEAIRDYAAQLLRMHADREMAGGFSFPEDGNDLAEFAGEFPYEETEDQLQAIAAIKADMERAQPMDRLLCGDVGYGKTEVAMRAAFKAVEAGKQVAVLVPTTVLAMQHYETFCERMSNFPVRIGTLSRFGKTKKTLEELALGSLDILIGTHRLVSPDVTFHDLGLLIVDEEQRFGVRVKEKLRAFRAGVDCLTLTATPIPRTLYLSLMGARDLSVIQTPPQDRLPITTIVAPFDEERIKQALLRELVRDGQAFFIHNRVDSIEFVATKIRTLLPKARIATAHGQMSAEEMDIAFHAFKEGKIDILVSTTIVENGIDVPNANTILIDRADRYGLADLYQLRGRVGRCSRRAYAYFFTPPARALSEIATERLQAIAEISGYGGGMKLAMRDLEIRGAGNILGVEQSGHVSRVGFNLYCRLLKRMVDRLQGKQVASLTPVKLEFPHDARIPEEYITEPKLRMEMYQRLGEAETEEELEALHDEVRDRFGVLPEAVLWLYHLMKLRVFAGRQHVVALQYKKKVLTIDYGSQGKRIVSLPSPASPSDLEQKVKKVFNPAC